MQIESQTSESSHPLEDFFIDTDLVLGRNNVEDIKCPICHSVFFNPVSCDQCMNHFCKSCQDKNYSRKCPMCNVPSKTRNAVPLLKQLLSQVILKCAYYQNGCYEKLPYDKFEKHIKLCDFQKVKCDIKYEHQEKIQNLTIELTKAKKEIQQLKQNVSEQENHRESLQQKIQELVLKNQKLSDEFTQYNELINKQFREKEEKIAVMEERKNKMIARIKNNQGKSKVLNGITTAIFDLFRQKHDISQFLIDENAMTDNQQFTVQKIIGRKEILEEKIKKLSDLDFNDAYKLEPVGEITCKRSIQPNGFGSYSKVSVLQDVNSKQFYVIKESNKFYTDQSISSLQQFFLPTLIAEFILDKFVQQLKKSYAGQPYKFRFQEQFIFQQNTKYYYAQKISQVDKFNLYNGKQNNQPDIKVCQYLNALTIFSYKYSVHQLMIDNVQGSSDTLYDPIINTDDGLFNEEDLGQDRIDELMRNAKDDAKFHGKQLLTSLSIKI